jgi:hypothetical protein
MIYGMRSCRCRGILRLRGSGETGRRDSLRSYWPKGRAGSTPVSRTTSKFQINPCLRNCTLRVLLHIARVTCHIRREHASTRLEPAFRLHIYHVTGQLVSRYYNPKFLCVCQFRHSRIVGNIFDYRGFAHCVAVNPICLPGGDLFTGSTPVL